MKNTQSPDNTLRTVVKKMRNPREVQDFLDSIPYRDEDEYCSPLRVVLDKKAHCFDGALFAACALEFQGHPPRIVDLKARHDDDHVIALFLRNGLYGAVAKSNFTGLRYREPVYRSLRELVMSYFEDYFTASGERSLRGYSSPLNLSRLNHLHWRTTSSNLLPIVEHLEQLRHFSIVPKGAKLTPVDERSLKAGMLGVSRKGLYRA